MTNSLLKRMYRQRWGYYFVLPSLIVFLMFSIFPLAANFFLSFTRYDLVSIEFTGFGNFLRIFRQSNFLTALKNTFLYVIGIVPLSIIFTLLVAVFVRKFNSKAQSFFLFAFYLPTVLSAPIIGTIWVWIYNPIVGPLTKIFAFIGLPRSDFLGNPDIAIVLIMIVYFTVIFGTPFIIFTAALNNIPESFYDSANIDGANNFQVLRYITIPLVKPTTNYLIMTITISVFQIWAIIHIMTGGGPLNKTLNLSYLMYKTGLLNYEFGIAASQGVILFLIIIIIAVNQFRFFSVDFEY